LTREPHTPVVLAYGLVFLGGGLGACLRLAAALTWGGRTGFPWVTFGVNVAGSFLMGALFGALSVLEPHPGWRLFLAVGVLGGFTTFSAFSMEGLALLQARSVGLWAAYALGSVAVGLAACWLGWEGARRVFGAG
jgi:fluoride exporter